MFSPTAIFLQLPRPSLNENFSVALYRLLHRVAWLYFWFKATEQRCNTYLCIGSVQSNYQGQVIPARPEIFDGTVNFATKAERLLAEGGFLQQEVSC